MFPFRRISLTIFVRTSSTFLAVSATAIMSVPQHAFTCFHIFPVEYAYFLSRNRRIVALHPRPLHLNSWARRPFNSMIFGVGWKNAYTGERHSLCKRSIRPVNTIFSYAGLQLNSLSSSSGVSSTGTGQLEVPVASSVSSTSSTCSASSVPLMLPGAA
jgi:hypothetical protein